MRISATLLLAALTLPGVAYAQNPNVHPSCDRQAKSICAPALYARLIVASGGVLLSRGVGFAEINSGATLAVGDRLLVKQGSAEIGIGPGHGQARPQLHGYVGREEGFSVRCRVIAEFKHGRSGPALASAPAVAPPNSH